MQNESRGTKNLMDIVDEHMKGDVFVRCRNVFDDCTNEKCREVSEFTKKYKESERRLLAEWQIIWR